MVQATRARWDYGLNQFFTSSRMEQTEMNTTRKIKVLIVDE